MPGPDVRDDWLVFGPRIEIVPPVEERCFGEIIRNIFQHILIMNLLKNSNGGVGPVSLLNMIEPRSVIPPVAHLVKLT